MQLPVQSAQLDACHKALHLQQIAHAVVVLHEHHLRRVNVELLAGTQQLQTVRASQKLVDLHFAYQLTLIVRGVVGTYLQKNQWMIV